MRQYEKTAQLNWTEVDALARKFAAMHPIILESDSERDDTSMYFRFRFNGGYSKAFTEFFSKYDTKGEYEARDEINLNGWATIPEEPTINMLNELGFFGFQVSHIVATRDWVYFMANANLNREIQTSGAEVFEDHFGITHCKSCMTELYCNPCGDMPEICPRCGKRLDYSIYDKHLLN